MVPMADRTLKFRVTRLLVKLHDRCRRQTLWVRWLGELLVPVCLRFLLCNTGVLALAKQYQHPHQY